MLALQGVFLYGVSYVCIYHAERFVPSGLVAVGYSASPLLAGVGAALLFGATLGPRFVIGGMLGLAGVTLIFWPEITGPNSSERAAYGAIFTVLSVLLSAVGSLTASRNSHRGIALLPAMGFGMLYGALAAAIVALALGRVATWPTAPSLVALARLPRLRRLGADLRLLPHAAGSRWPGPGRNGRRDDAADRVGGLARLRGLSPRSAHRRRRRPRGRRQRAHVEAGTERASGNGAGRSGSGMNSVSPGTFGKR